MIDINTATFMFDVWEHFSHYKPMHKLKNIVFVDNMDRANMVWEELIDGQIVQYNGKVKVFSYKEDNVLKKYRLALCNAAYNGHGKILVVQKQVEEK